MAEKTKIAWCDKTFNLWRGCTKVSEGCANCYAETLSRRNPETLGQWGPGAPRVFAAKAYALDPFRWQAIAVKRRELFQKAGSDEARLAKLASADGVGPRRERVFCASLSDVLDSDGVPSAWFAELADLWRLTPGLEWLALTKRPEAFYDRMQAAWKWAYNTGDGGKPLADWLYAWGKQGQAPPNVWFGISGENNKRLWQRWGHAKLVKARVHFLSLEPLLEDVADTVETIIAEAVAMRLNLWVIVGGESGADARPFGAEWAERVLLACRRADVPCFVKQMGSNAHTDSPERWPGATRWKERLPAAGHLWLRDSKGGDPAEWPEYLRVQQHPVTPVLLE